MRRNILGQTGIEVSQLGLGCSQLLNQKERRDAIRILEQAFELGITHFDVARVYGFGRAEGILGEFLRGKRHKVTVATKFGIQPPAGVTGDRRVAALAKKLLGPFPGLVRRLRQRRSKMVQTGVFSPQSAVQSLETSLRELGTDSVDIFFLHEATLQDAANEALIAVLQQQVARGTIRCLGVASRFQNLECDARRVPPVYQVLQFDDNASDQNLSTLQGRERFALITHSIFKPFGVLRAAVSAQPALVEEYTTQIGLDLADPKITGSLLLHYALRENSAGVVLFSTSDPQRVACNVRDASSHPFSGEQLSRFAEFARAAAKRTAAQ